VLTDEFGNFSFERLGTEENYLISLGTEEPAMNIAFVTEEGRVFDFAVTNKEGYYKLESQLDASRNIEQSKNEGYTTLIARLEHRGLPLKYTTVRIYDSKNNLIATVISNENGEFQFNHLEFDDVYFIELPELDEQTKYESLAYVIDQGGNPLYLINQLKDGRFKFFSLPYDEYKLVQQEEISFVPNIIKVAGQLYKRLPGDYSDGIKVYVLNQEGEIIDSTFTDGRGKFKFEKLRSDETYSFKVAGGGEDFNLALLDKNDVIIDKGIMNEKGNFSYKKLTYQVAQFEQLEAVEADLVEETYNHEIYGQVYQKLPGDFGDSMKVFIYDEEGNFLGTAYTDEKGKFKFSKLKEDQNYFFKIEHNEEQFQLLTLDEDENVIDKTIKNRLGQFKYSKLGMEHHKILLEEASDHQILYYDNQKIDLTKFTVHYRFDKSSLERQELEKIKKLVEVLKDKDLKVEVISHTDLRGNKEYNKNLSHERTNNIINYLVQFGLSKKKLVGNFFGELKPVIDCDKYKCDNDDHRLNRRTEFKFLDFDLNELETK
jgi:outer membrane protein OmpA-like peptidoglycan-associated protein